MSLLRVDPHDVEAGDFLMGHGFIVAVIEFYKCRWRFSSGEGDHATVPMSARVTVHRDKKG